jgi:ribosomal protein S18 acetylase RimI-like enzyme
MHNGAVLCSAPILTPEIAALLGRAMFPDPERIARALEAYRTEPERRVFVWEVGGKAVCAAGLRVAGPEAELLHIGTRPDQEGHGFGSELLRAIAVSLALSRLTAETDEDSVGFYRRGGFEVGDAPNRAGRRRFLCTLTLER